jgi:hypothetical protein
MPDPRPRLDGYSEKGGIMARSRWKISIVVVAAFLAGALTIVAAGALSTPAGVTRVSGGGSSRVAVARGSNQVSTTSGSWVNLPGAAVNIKVPRRTKALLIATFSGESICSGGSVADECDIRIMFGTKQGKPGPAAPNSGAAFDSVGTSGADYREMHAIQRSLGPLGPGTYTVKVQWQTCCGTTFNLDDWHLTVESFKA